MALLPIESRPFSGPGSAAPSGADREPKLAGSGRTRAKPSGTGGSNPSRSVKQSVYFAYISEKVENSVRNSYSGSHLLENHPVSEDGLKIAPTKH